MKIRALLGLGIVILLGGCSQRHGRIALSKGPLPAPALVAPRDQAVFTNHPRTVRFAWSRVPQAASYTLEIDCLGCCARDRWCSDAQGHGQLVPNLAAIAYTFTFWGDQRGRWRVWAVDARSKPGTKSEWAGFVFQPARPESRPENSRKPSPFGTPVR